MLHSIATPFAVCLSARANWTSACTDCKHHVSCTVASATNIAAMRTVQVQRMALKTLLKRHWPPAVLAQLPLSFFTGTLLPALMSPIHHKVPSAAGLSATGSAVAGADTQQQQQPAIATATGQAGNAAGSSFNVISQAAELLREYVAAAGPAAARALLLSGLLVAAKPGQDLPRSGLLAVMKALAAAADAAAAGGSLLADMSESDAGVELKPKRILCRVVLWKG
jgi:hypothetical protein